MRDSVDLPTEDRWRKRGLLSICLVLCFLLSGCVLETDVTLYKGERWGAEMILTMTAGELALMGGEEELRQSFEAGMEEEEGVDYSVKTEQSSDGSLSYIISLQGTDWERLNDLVFDGQAAIQADESSGSRRVVFHYNPGSSDYMFTQATYRLHGGHIIESNADRVEGGTAIWYNPSGSLRAVLTEKSRVSVPLVVGGVLCTLLVVGLVVAAGGVGVFALSRRSAKPVFCIKCGTPNEAGDQHCIKCAEKLEE